MQDAVFAVKAFGHRPHERHKRLERYTGDVVPVLGLFVGRRRGRNISVGMKPAVEIFMAGDRVCCTCNYTHESRAYSGEIMKSVAELGSGVLPERRRWGWGKSLKSNL
jgi:hypothetical protein